jgi:hypothetical protein
MYTDTFFTNKTSARGNTCAQLFVTAEGFVAGKPMKSKGDAYEVLNFICREYRIPKMLVSDNAHEETLGYWGRVAKQTLLRQRMTKAYSVWQNRCETEIREFRKHFQRIMFLNRCPEAFWDFDFEYIIKVRQFLIRKTSDDRPPIETVTGESCDTSEFMEFDFYQFIKYRDAKHVDDPIKLGRWLGVAHDMSSALTYWVLKSNGQIIARSTVRPLLPEEWKIEQEIQLQKDFDDVIKSRYGDYDPELLHVFDNEDMIQPRHGEHGEHIGDLNIGSGDGDNATNDAIVDNVVRGPDPFNNAEVYLPHSDRNETAKVIGRKRNADANYIGRAHTNPILDSRIFTVRFSNG